MSVNRKFCLSLLLPKLGSFHIMYVELVGQSFRYLVLISYWSNRCQFNSVLSKKTCKWDKWIYLNHSKRVVCKL